MQNPTLGERIKEKRERGGMSMGQLARASGVSAAAISRIESGERTSPGIDTLESLASALGISLVELLDLQEGDMEGQLKELWSSLGATERAKLLTIGHALRDVDERAEALRNLGYALNEDALFFGGDLRVHIERLVDGILQAKGRDSSLVASEVVGVGEVREREKVLS